MSEWYRNAHRLVIEHQSSRFRSDWSLQEAQFKSLDLFRSLNNRRKYEQRYYFKWAIFLKMEQFSEVDITNMGSRNVGRLENFAAMPPNLKMSSLQDKLPIISAQETILSMEQQVCQFTIKLFCNTLIT